MAAKEGYGSYEDAGGGEGEQADGAAVGALGGGGRGGGVIAAVGAALRAGGGGYKKEGGQEEEGRPLMSGASCSDSNLLRRSLPVEKQIALLRCGMTAKKDHAIQERWRATPTHPLPCGMTANKAAEKEGFGSGKEHCWNYWKKARRAKRKIQKRPMQCQYQAAQSTRIWRVSIWRET